MVAATDTDPVITSLSGSSAPAGYRFPREVIALAVRWYLRYGLSYRDVEELLAERGIEVDHVTIYRWARTFTPELIDAARPARHASGNKWFIDETYVKVAGRWAYLYRAVDQHQVAVNGDLANWHTGEPDAISAVGGAMDLAIGAKTVYVMMNLFTSDGTPKLVPACTYPLNRLGCVSRVYTERVRDTSGLLIRVEQVRS
jgi:hypothetical protein